MDIHVVYVWSRFPYELVYRRIDSKKTPKLARNKDRVDQVVFFLSLGSSQLMYLKWNNVIREKGTKSYQEDNS